MSVGELVIATYMFDSGGGGGAEGPLLGGGGEGRGVADASSSLSKLSERCTTRIDDRQSHSANWAGPWGGRESRARGGGGGGSGWGRWRWVKWLVTAETDSRAAVSIDGNG